MKFFIKVVLITLLAVSVFTTCDSPMGMGDEIDWEAPVLTLDPLDNPLYVRTGTIITGKVTDNVEVDRIVLVEIKTNGKEEVIFTAEIKQKESYFSIPLIFPASLNGERIKAEIRAYDLMGNCGAESIQSITMIIDIYPPITESILIKRTDSRTAELLPLSTLRKLAEDDPNGTIKKDLYKYQNGWFYIDAIAVDEETTIDKIYLEFYDYLHPNDCLLSIEQDKGYSTYFPRWTVKEEDIINEGDAKFGNNYKNNYYYNTAHYFYKVVIKAIDMSKNTSIQEEPGYICMFAETDKPRGLIDPGVGAIVPKATPLPVDCYDDDSLYWVFTGLFTKDQWDGVTGSAGLIAPSTRIPQGNDESKLLWLKQRLTGNSGAANTDVSVEDSVLGGSATTTYNWKYGKYASPDTSEPIKEQIGKSNVDEKLIYIPTGNGVNDYGDFVLFTIVADKKLSPHNGDGPEWTNKGIWTGRAVPVQVIDENEPLIVFDTDKSLNPSYWPTKYFCPEENTFPDPLIDVNGAKVLEQKYFDIYGYTLREDTSGFNSVTKFRMAWIPLGMPGGPDKFIPEVKKALSEPGLFASNANLAGVQYWDFNVGGAAADGMLTAKATVKIPEDPKDGVQTTYAKQIFKYRFSVMGDDDIKKSSGTNTSAYKNFTYNNKLENETKLFIIYALDNMGHEVYRQLRLLGYKEEPDLNIYDITNRFLINSNDLPNPSKTEYIEQGTGSPTDTYYTALDNYNRFSIRPATYNSIKSNAIGGAGLTDKDIQTSAFQMYPRETVLKYYVKSDQTGKIPIDTITMKDITFKGTATAPEVGSRYQAGDTALSFCEYYPDVTTRTFLFIAEDKLGNTRQIQRTIAITNAARLERITSTTQSGKYGIGTIITLRAEFSSLIYVNGSVQLYVRYKNKTGGRIYEQLNCKTVTSSTNPATALEFDFTVKEDYTGDLETMYDASDFSDAPDKHPIRITSGRVMDYNRNDDAFIPGYNTTNVNMPNWTTDKGSLQEKKKITLDGIRPTVLSLTFDGKAAYEDGKRYFKNGETITLAIESDKPIRASGDSTLEYFINDRPTDGSGTRRGPFTANFKYSKPGATNKILIYSLTVNEDNFKWPQNTGTRYDGMLMDVTLYTPYPNEAANYIGIVDEVGNAIIKTTGILTVNDGKLGNINVKQTLPAAPAATLTNTTSYPTATLISSITASPLYLTGSADFNIPNSSSVFSAWEDIKEFSTDGGISWKAFPYTPPTPLNTPGTYRLQLRYKDRAGNEGAVRDKTIEIKDSFPALISVNTVQANGTYRKGSTLTFNLNFADVVYTRDPINTTAYPVSITLKNRSATQRDNSTHTITLSAAQTNTSTISFNWPNIADAEMWDGLYISDINLSGLRDKYGIIGPGGGTGDYTTGENGIITINSKTCSNLTSGVIVDAVNPTILTRTPVHLDPPSGNDLVKDIKIKFNEKVMRGSGTITIRPRAGFAIPPVLDDTGYYIGYTNNGLTTGTEGEAQLIPTKFKTAGTNRTYISSFYDVYNAIPSGANQSVLRNYLTKSPSGASMSDLELSLRTGQPVGPYKKLTHGLVNGKGYSGNYSGTDQATGPDGNAYDALVPDTATKWVLDFKYGIIQDIAAVKNIRIALSAAKWRWQEIDVVTAQGDGTDTMTIKLNEPLLKGLSYDVIYTEGTFTDMAGNPASGSGFNTARKDTTANNVYTLNENISLGTTGDYVPIIVNGVHYTAYLVNATTARTFRIHPFGTSTGGGTTAGQNLGSDITVCINPSDYFFTTPGVQAPVIRVNRRSSDSRSENFKDQTTVYAELNASTPGWNTNNITIDDDIGWGKTDFNYIYYRVESETPGADVSAQYYTATPEDDNPYSTHKTAVKGAWTGNVAAANSITPAPANDMAWNAPAANTRGTWVLPNIVRRSQTANGQSYSVVNKNGVTETRSFNGVLRMFKSYNRDLTAVELGYPSPTAGPTSGIVLKDVGDTKSPSLSKNDTIKGQSYLLFDNYEASKSYIIGKATLHGQTAKGIEGIYRTVIMLNNGSSRDSNYIAVEGSNIKNGMPSLAGFPVRDADEADARFLKVFFKQSADNTQWYWVSTEIVCEWYFLGWGGRTSNTNTRNGTHTNAGEVSNNMISGYGDLTYSFNIRFNYDTAPSN
jgi:hypothetical protein